MENYIVSARKYRPATFSSVIGQKALTSTLKNAIATDRLAHAYLFCGSRGVGKTSCARIFAKSINCSNPTPDGDPCNQCDSCRDFNENRSLNIVELDAASNNGVEDMRNLIEQVLIPPTNGRYRVFIIDEVHMLSNQAFNAFLKTLEEPPSYVIFILATTEKQKIIPTILSRCQIYDFSRITTTDMVDHLEYVARQEGYTAERAALNVIASKADGAMRDALSIFDQVAASSRGNITYTSTIENLNVLDDAYYGRLVEAFIKGDVSEALLIYKEIRDRGFDSRFFINGLAAYLRDLMVARDPRTLELLDTDREVKDRMAEVASKCPVDFYYKAMSLCNDADLNYRDASSKTFLVELLLIKLCQLLSPSPNSDGNGEGRLKPLPKGNAVATSSQPQSSAGPQPQSAGSAPSQAAAPADDAPASSGSHAPRQPHPSSPRPAAPAPSMSRQPALGRALRSTHPVDKPRDAAPASSNHAPEDAPRSAAYTDSQLRQAWDDFALSLTTERILANTMRACVPQNRGNDLFEVTVENDMQVEDLTRVMPRLLESLRAALNNDNIKINITVSTTISPTAWNNRELLQHLIEQSPGVARMVEKLKLSLM